MLAVVTIIALIMSLLIPALSASKQRAEGIFCMNNLKSVHLAWAMYADDNGDWLPGVAGGSFPDSNKWISGWLDFSSSSDNTNTLYLTDPRFAQIGPYVQDPEIFHCPSDTSTVNIGGHTYHRVRSISMNCWMNYVGTAYIGQDEYRVFRHMSDIVNPSPDNAWVVMDERADSINDGMFQTDLKDRRVAAKIVDYPASYHNGAAGIAFADGHTELKRWVDPRTNPAYRPSQSLELNIPSPDNPDVAWLQDHSSSKLPTK